MTSSDERRPVRVSVITLTYRRPDDLAAALPMLLAHVQEVPGAELLVVDNDEQPSARAVVELLAAAGPVRYVHEPRPGIAAARNRGLAETRDADVIVFVDDDERPTDGWLPALLDTFWTHRSTGVAGRVVSELDGPVDPWILDGGFFDRLRHPTGTTVKVVATNNLLLDAAAVRAWGLRFDEEFGLSGGSDTVFSLEVGRRGGTFVWCDEAVVVDVVPPSRLTRRWVVRRAFRSGNSGSRAAVHVCQGTRERLVTRAAGAGRGLVRIAGGLARLVVGTVRRDRPTVVRAVRTVVRGAGMVSGAAGYVFAEYTRSSGRSSRSGRSRPTARMSSGTEL